MKINKNLLGLAALFIGALGIPFPAQNIKAVEVLGSLKGFFEFKDDKNTRVDNIEPSAVEAVCGGKYLLIAHDKDEQPMRLVETATGMVLGEVLFPGVTKNPKWEGLAMDEGGQIYVIGSHNDDEKEKIPARSRLLRFSLNVSDCSSARKITLKGLSDDLDAKESLRKLKIYDDTKPSIEGTSVKIEGLAWQKTFSGEHLVVGLRDPFDAEFVQVFRAGISLQTKFLDLQQYFRFEAKKPVGSPVPFKLSSIEYVESLKGFLILTSTEGSENLFYGNALWYASQSSIDTASTNGKVATVTPECLIGCGARLYQPDMKAEGLAVVSDDPTKGVMKLVVVFDNDYKSQSKRNPPAEGAAAASGMFEMIDLTYKLSDK